MKEKSEPLFSADEPTSSYLTSEKGQEVLVSIPSARSPSVNTNKFCFLSHSPISVKMSDTFTIVSWKNGRDILNNKRKNDDTEPAPETNFQKHARLCATIDKFKDDEEFLDRLDAFLKRDGLLKNSDPQSNTHQ